MVVASSSCITISEMSDAVYIPHEAPKPSFQKDSRFWLVFAALCISSFLSALDLTAVSTVLPTMANELHSAEYSWIGTA